ncbi:MAG: HlyD family type I secretion periplasmic adaptor subunit, partial [Alphaproteobacteria bacterium]
GQLFVSGNRKQIQHLEGGIVRQLFVREGSTVQAGDPIIELDPTQADASLGLLQSRLAYAVARESRLNAERANRRNIQFPDWLARERSNPKVRAILEAEESALRAARAVVRDQSGIWGSRVRQLEEESNGLRAEIQSNVDQLSLIQQEIADQKFLVDRGLGIRRLLLGLQRQATEIRGRKARAESGIARNKQAIGESRLRISELVKARLTEIDNELGQLSSEIAGLRERLSAARDVRQRTVIRAPVSGKVVN